MRVKFSKAISLVETILTLGLLSILSILIFPILKSSNTLTNSFISQSLISKDSERILLIIENCINNSSIIDRDYLGKEWVKNGFLILDYNGIFSQSLGENFYQHSSTEGNTLYLEYPRSNGKTIKLSILIFRFLYGELTVAEFEVGKNDVFIVNSDVILENVHGSFKKNRYGIIIELEVTSSDFSVKEKLIGYGRFKK